MNIKTLATVLLLILAGLAIIPAHAEPGKGNATAVAAGYGHTCVLQSTGNVDCYGSNNSGETADYTLGDAVAVAAGTFNTCVLKTTRNVDCYGYAPAAVDYAGGDALAVSAQASHRCVLKVNGNVDCAGYPTTAPEVGDYTGGDATAVFTGSYHTCVLKANRNVDCYGTNTFNNQAVDYTAGDALAVGAGTTFTCVLKLNGNVDCYGSLTQDYTTGDATAVSAGEHVCILTTSHNVKCWGSNSYGEAVTYMGGDAESVSAGKDHTCIVKTSGTVECFGRDPQATDYVTPSPPQSLQAEPASQGEIVLNWQAPQQSGYAAVTNYAIYRGTTTGLEAYVTTVGDVRTWTDTGLPDDATRYYTVTALNQVGESTYSNEASATTDSTVSVDGVCAMANDCTMPSPTAPTSSRVGAPTGPAVPMPPSDTKGYVVIPWGGAPEIRGVPAPDATGTIAILFFLTDLPDATAGNARLRALNPLGGVLYDESKEVYFEDGHTTAGLAYFEAIPSQGAAKLEFSYGSVSQDMGVDDLDVPDVNCQPIDSCIDPCPDVVCLDNPCDYYDEAPGTCNNPPPNYCDYVHNVPGVCNSPPLVPCNQAVVRDVPPCEPLPPLFQCPEGAVDCVCDNVPTGCDPDACPGHPITEVDECLGIITLNCPDLTDCLPEPCGNGLNVDCILCPLTRSQTSTQSVSNCMPEPPTVCTGSCLPVSCTTTNSVEPNVPACVYLTPNNADVCAKPSCYEIALPMTMSPASQDVSGCRLSLGVDGHAWLPTRYEQNKTDANGHALDVVDYATTGWAKKIGYQNTCNSAYQGGGVYAFGVQWSGPQDLRVLHEDTVYSAFFYHGSSLRCAGSSQGTEFGRCEPYSNHELWARPDTWAVVVPNDAHFQFTQKPTVWMNGREKHATECSPFLQVAVAANAVANVLLGFYTLGAWQAVGFGAGQVILGAYLEDQACKLTRWTEVKGDARGERIMEGVGVADRSYDAAISMKDQREAFVKFPVYVGGCASEGIDFNTMSRVEWSAEATAGSVHDSMPIQWDGDSTVQKLAIDCES